MKTKTNKIVALALIAATFSFSSCKKEETPVKNTVSAMTYSQKMEIFKKGSQKQLVVNESFMQLTGLVQQILTNVRLSGKKEGNIFTDFPCATIATDSSSTPTITTFDFGSTGCTDADGRFYAGKLTIRYNSTDWSNPGTRVSVAIDSFKVDTVTINGTVNFSTNGLNANGNPTGSGTMNVQTSFTADRVTVNGLNNLTYEIDKANQQAFVDINGNGTTSDGLSYTQSTTSTLVHIFGCRHFAAGTLLIQSPGLPDEQIDYGNHACDDQATSTINGVTTTFTLH